MADQPLGTSGQMVLLEKGTPQIVIDPAQNPRGDSRQNPVDCRAFNSVLVDVIAAAPNTLPTTVTVIGSPVGSEPWIQEWDPNAIQSIPAGTNKRFLVTAVSAWVAVDLTQAAGWRVVITPLDSPAQTTINFTSGANMNLAEVGGAAIGPANPVPTAPQGTANMNLGQVGGANLTLGQKVSANSVPVVVASDQSVLSVQPLHPAAISGTFTTLSTPGTSVVGPVSMQNLGSAIVTVHGAYGAGLQIAFEADDGSGTWYPIQATRSDGFTSENTSGALAANQSRAWEFGLGGYTSFRVRDLANPASGSATITIISTAESAVPSVVAGPPRGNKSAPVAITVNAAALQVLAANTQRKSAMFQNLGSTDIYLGRDATVTVGGAASGIKLPGGQTVPTSISDFASSDAWYAIGSAAGGLLAVLEVS